MNKILFVIILISFCFKSYCQNKILFTENFSNNKNEWGLQNDSSFSVSIDKGKLRIEKLKKNFDDRGCLWYKKEIPELNTLENFSITIYAKFISGGDILEMFELQWGDWDTKVSSKVTSIYQLNFFLKGDVKLDYFNNGWNYSLREKIKEIDKHNPFLNEEFNKFEVIQKDGFVIFNINDKPFFKQFANPIAGNSLGIQGCLKSVWEIDKIVVKQLKNSSQKIEKLNIQIANSAKNDSTKISESIKVFPNPFIEEFTVNISMEVSSIVTITLFDINGNMVLQTERNLKVGNHLIHLYANVSPGNYVLNVSTNSKKSTTTLVKL